MRTHRRDFLKLGFAGVASAWAAGCRSPDRSGAGQRPAGRLFFTSQGRTGVIGADGLGLEYFEFDRPHQVTWQPGPFLSDGRHVIFLSMEARRDGPGRPFDRYYHQTPTHLWLYDLERRTLTEIATRNRLAVFYTPALLVSDQRLLVQVVRDQGGQIYSMNLDGTDAHEFTRLGEGLPYGLSLSPDGQRVAYHLASPQGYQIWTSAIDGGARQLVAANPERLYFGPSWSADGDWLLFQYCHHRTDPGHDWSDLCVARPDGSEVKDLTAGQVMWFGATYGPPQNRGGGSNVPSWTRDGLVLFPRRMPDSQVPWEFQASRPDVDHFNREYRPDQARGGVQICRLDPHTGISEALTPGHAGTWDFRVSESPDGQQMAFCRAATGGVPGLWILEEPGPQARLLTRGWQEQGADHPRWLPPAGRPAGEKGA